MLSGKRRFCSKMSDLANKKRCKRCVAERPGCWLWMHLSFGTHLGRGSACTNVLHGEPQLSAATGPDADAGWLLQIQEPG